MSEKAPSVQEPTKKQLEVFRFIQGFIKENIYSPSYREVKDALGLKSVSTVAIHVDALIACGYLEKQGRSARSLRVLKDAVPGKVYGGSTEEVSSQVHLDWLKQELDKRQADESLSNEAAILKAALQLLDHTDKE